MTNAYSELDRRESPRVASQVALRYRAISEARFSDELEKAEPRRARLTLLDQIINPAPKDIETFIKIRKRDPEIADFVQGLAEKLEALARLLMQENEQLATRPTHNVVLSATGMLFQDHAHFQRGNAIELQFRLFPSRRRIVVLAEVVKCEEKGGSGQRSIAVSFTYISDEDRQLLRDHVDAILRTQGGEEVEARA